MAQVNLKNTPLILSKIRGNSICTGDISKFDTQKINIELAEEWLASLPQEFLNNPNKSIDIGDLARFAIERNVVSAAEEVIALKFAIYSVLIDRICLVLNKYIR